MATREVKYLAIQQLKRIEGRYGWLLSEPVLFDQPIPAKGKLRLWEYELG